MFLKLRSIVRKILGTLLGVKYGPQDVKNHACAAKKHLHRIVVLWLPLKSKKEKSRHLSSQRENGGAGALGQS